MFIDVVGSSDGYDPKDFIRFAQFTPKEVAAFLREFNGRGLFSMLARFYRRMEHENEPLRTTLRTTMDAAIARVEKDDPLNRLRVESLRQRIAKTQES